MGAAVSDQAPIHPGIVMRQVLERKNLSVRDAARSMGVTPPALHAVLKGRCRLSAEMALRFAHVTGEGPRPYLDMQADRDIWHASRKLAATLRKIEGQAG